MGSSLSSQRQLDWPAAQLLSQPPHPRDAPLVGLCAFRDAHYRASASDDSRSNRSPGEIDECQQRAASSQLSRFRRLSLPSGSGNRIIRSAPGRGGPKQFNALCAARQPSA
jgi:hypothetical protein